MTEFDYSGLKLETLIKNEYPNVYSYFKRHQSRSVVRAYERMKKQTN